MSEVQAEQLIQVLFEINKSIREVKEAIEAETWRKENDRLQDLV